MDDALKDLFPAINPNIDEIGQDMTPLDEDEQIKNDDVEPEVETKQDYNEDDIFMKQGKKLKSKLKEPTDTITESDTKPKRNYSHLAKARAKGAEIRKQKAEARRLKKQQEKEEKERIRAEKRAATKERNRQKARERYHKQKELNTLLTTSEKDMWLKELDELQEHYQKWDQETKPIDDVVSKTKKKIKIKTKTKTKKKNKSV